MSPSDKPNTDDEVLNRLIRACRDEEPAEGFVRPEPDAITAYLVGTATEEQRKSVRSALVRSSEFRRELLETMRDMDLVENLDLAAYEREANQISVPDLREFQERDVSQEPGRQLLAGKLKKIWSTLTELRVPQLYAPTVAALLVIALVVIKMVDFGGPDGTKAPILGQWNPVAQKVDPGYFVSDVTRAPATESTGYGVFQEPQEAALAKFGSLIHYEDGRLRFTPPEKSKPLPECQTFRLRFVDSEGKTFQEFETYIPIAEAKIQEHVVAWAIALPSLDLYRLEMKSDFVSIPWGAEMGSYGCVTFTHPVKKGYVATEGFLFDLR